MSCIYGKCKNPEQWQIKNSHGAIVGYLCEDHRKNTWAVTSHPGTIVQPKGDSTPYGTHPEKACETPDKVRGIDDPDRAPRLPESTWMADERPNSDGDGGGYGDLPAPWQPAVPRFSESEPGKSQEPAEIISTPERGIDWRTAGVQCFTPEQEEILRAPLDPDQIAIRPTGELYLPQVFYRQRLLDAFGPGGWAMVPLSKLMLQDGFAMAHYSLVAEGRIVGEAVGEMAIIPKNRRQTDAQLKEGAKSDALTRICKDLGVAWECWNPHYCTQWKKTYAIQVARAGSREYQWRRIDAEPWHDEVRPKRKPESEYERPRDFTDDARDHWDDMTSYKGDS